MAGWDDVPDASAKPAATAKGWDAVPDAKAPTVDGFRTLPGASFPTRQIVAPGTDKPSEQREDGGIYFGPAQGNKGKPGWFDAKGMRLGDAPGKSAGIIDTATNHMQGLAQEDQSKPLLGQEAGLVIHLLRPLDPIAEIDIGKAHGASSGNMVEDHQGPEATISLSGFVEGIDKG